LLARAATNADLDALPQLNQFPGKRCRSQNGARLETGMLTLGQAAKQCGVSKGTLSKAIASGKLSATRREDGSWSIDGAELTRYFEANAHRFRPETVPSEQLETAAELRFRAELAEQRLADLRAMYEDMCEQRNKWETVATRLALPAPKPVETAPATRSRSWWPWRRAAG
jgi:excisionase family DNA binding protein